MSSDRIYKVGGPALFIGAILSIISGLYSAVAYGGARPSYAGDSLWGTVLLIGLIGGILVVLGFTTAYMRQANTAGDLGLWGWAISTIAGILFVGLLIIQSVVYPAIDAADQKIFVLSSVSPAGFFILYLIILVTFTVGPILFGIATNRAKVYAGWIGSALIAMGILMVVLSAAAGAVPSLGPIAGPAPILLFYVIVGAMGYWLGMQDKGLAS